MAVDENDEVGASKAEAARCAAILGMAGEGVPYDLLTAMIAQGMTDDAAMAAILEYVNEGFVQLPHGGQWGEPKEIQS